MRLATTLLVSALLACPAAVTTAARAASDGDVERLITQKLIPSVMGDAGIGGVAVAVRIGGRTLFFNHGFAEMTSRRPVTPDSLFNLASLRKVFEVLLLAQAVQRGEVRFDDPVAQYVPELQKGSYIREVTLGQLASHTSGLLLPPDHPPWPTQRIPLAGFVDLLNGWTPDKGQRPGRQHTYTHAGYVLLQLALERRFARPIGALIGERVTKPLGLNATVLPEGPLNAPRAPLANAVQGYGDDGTPIGIPGNQQSYYDFPGTGQMFSSARDLATLLAAHLGEIPVEPELRAALQSVQRGVLRISPHITQALAWEIIDTEGPNLVDKPGGINNASAYIGMVPGRKIGLVILANRGGRDLHEIARNVILPALARL